MSFWSKRVLPTLVDRVCGRDAISEERARWVPRAEGRVLEVGVGSGLNFSFYDNERVERVLGVDPSAALLVKARKRATRARVSIELAVGAAEALPVDAASFDTVVLTYTLCSVDDPARALAEMRRALKPTGKLVFIEHGLTPDVTARRWQHRLTPAWRRVAGNCHLNRDIAREITGAGFSIVESHSTYSDGPRWLAFTAQGVATPA